MKLKDYAREKGLKERELAEILGTSQQHVNRIMQGIQNPSIELARRIGLMTKGKVSLEDLCNTDLPTKLHVKNKKRIHAKYTA